MSEEYPPPVAKLHTALKRLAGISETCSGIRCVDGLKEEDLSLACFSVLPHGAMRRTHGAIANEVQVQIEFRIAPSPEGLRSLEFLAWWIRDAARGSLAIQLRPIGYPPTMGDDVQLGRTLCFHIDYFFWHPSRDLEPVLSSIDKLADDLNHTIDLYEYSLRERGGPSLLARLENI